MKGSVFVKVPEYVPLAQALEQQTKRNIKRVSLIARFDIIAYNPQTSRLEVWGRIKGRNGVILSKEINLDSPKHFLHMAQLIGSVANLYCLASEERVPAPWWAYRFV